MSLSVFAATKPMSKPVLHRVLPFAVFVALMALDPLLSGVVDKWIDGHWLYGLRCVVTLFLLLAFWPELRELRWQRVTAGQWLLTFITGIAVLVLWVNLDRNWLMLGKPGSGFVPLHDGNIDWPLVVMRLLGSALVVPVMEELFWRSFLMRWIVKQDFRNLAPQYITLSGLLLSSVAFGLSHILWFAGIVAGIAYGLLYRHTSNLWLAVVAHAITNAGLGVWILVTHNWQFW